MPRWNASFHDGSWGHCEWSCLNHLKETTGTDRDHSPPAMQCKETLDSEVISKVPCEKQMLTTESRKATELHLFCNQNVQETDPSFTIIIKQMGKTTLGRKWEQ